MVHVWVYFRLYSHARQQNILRPELNNINSKWFPKKITFRKNCNAKNLVMAAHERLKLRRKQPFRLITGWFLWPIKHFHVMQSSLKWRGLGVFQSTFNAMNLYYTGETHDSWRDFVRECASVYPSCSQGWRILVTDLLRLNHCHGSLAVQRAQFNHDEGPDA